MSLHPGTWSLFRVFSLSHAACLAEKQQIPMYECDVVRQHMGRGEEFTTVMLGTDKGVAGFWKKTHPLHFHIPSSWNPYPHIFCITKVKLCTGVQLIFETPSHPYILSAWKPYRYICSTKTTTHSYVIGVIVDPFIHLIKIIKNALININFTLDQLMVRGYTVVFNATFNTISAISWQSVLLVEETGIPGETHRPAASHR
jgi:hypothetical protein